MPPAPLDTTESDTALRRLPTTCQDQTEVLRMVAIELQEHKLTKRDLKG